MANTYTLIASNTLSSAAASVTFSAIPGTYTDLILKVSLRSTQAAVDWSVGNLRFNANSSAIYSQTLVEASGSAASSYTAGGDTSSFVVFNGTNTTSNTFTSAEYYFPSYTASQNKPFSEFLAAENNSSTINYVRGIARLFRSTAAITSIDFAIAGTNFAAGSSFFLYGIKNS